MIEFKSYCVLTSSVFWKSVQYRPVSLKSSIPQILGTVLMQMVINSSNHPEIHEGTQTHDASGPTYTQLSSPLHTQQI